MKRRILLFIFTCLSAFINAQQKVVSLYAVGSVPPGEPPTEKVNEKNLFQTKVVYNITSPTLSVFVPDVSVANGTAVVIAPGGGFHLLSINSEGFDVANWLVKKGITCFVLKYRLVHIKSDDPVGEMMGKMGKKEWDEDVNKVIPLALADGKAALAFVRKHAAEFNISPDRIGIIGFSAGGTVAANSAFGYTKDDRPDFVAPIYPYFPADMHGPLPADAPPLFIATASDDQLGLAPHSVDLYNKWLSAKKSAELHMYAKGDHGFGMRKQNLPSDSWIERFSEWLGIQGFLTKKASNAALEIYQKKEFLFAEGKVLPYRILYPENYDKNKKYPLLLFLHGAGERGKDNEKQLVHGSKLFITPENRKSFPAIIVIPQCPEESFWAATKIDRTVQPFKIEFDYSAEPNWPLAAANALVKKLSIEEGVDKSKIYITGLSMGGMGTFESVYRFPEMYAAALPICGGGDVSHFDKRVTKTAFWVFHGAADAVVDVKLSREMVEKLKTLKAEIKYSEYPGVNHNSWDNAFAEKDYLSWMLQHKKK